MATKFVGNFSRGEVTTFRSIFEKHPVSERTIISVVPGQPCRDQVFKIILEPQTLQFRKELETSFIVGSMGEWSSRFKKVRS